MTLNDALAIEIARAELAHPTFAVTEQYLEVHILEQEGEEPRVAAVVRVEGRVDVYFRLKGQSYFLVIPVNPEGEGWAVGCCRAEARSRVTLVIRSETMTAPEITEVLGLTPTESFSKGDAHLLPQLKPLGPRTFTGWFLSPDEDVPGEVETKLSRLLDLTESAAPSIRELANRCDVVVAVLYNGYSNQMWGLSFEARDVARLAALGVSIDVDLYASGPDLR
jgi:hypothetical protein